MARTYRKKKGDLAINTIMIMFVAIISILLLLALFGGKMPTFAKQIYCMTFYKVQQSSVMPKAFKADTTMCEEIEKLNFHNIYKEETVINTFSDGGQVMRSGPVSGPPSGGVPFYITLENVTIHNSTFDMVLRSANMGGDRDNFFFKVNTTYDDRLAFTAYQGQPLTRNFFYLINNSLSHCTNFPCTMEFTVFPLGGAQYFVDFAIQNLRVVVDGCFVREEVIASMLACWERVNYGDYPEDFLCDELVLNPACNENYQLTPRMVAQTIVDEDLCEYLPMMVAPYDPDESCLNDNRVEFLIDEVTQETNVLIEFDSAQRLIRVS